MMNYIETSWMQRIFMHSNAVIGLVAFGTAYQTGLTLLATCGIINFVCAWIAHQNMKFYKVRERS